MSTMFADLYATRNDPRPEMIPKIDVNTTPNDPQFFSHATPNDPQNRRKHDPKWSPNFFTRDLKWSPKNYRSGIGKHFFLGDKIKAF